MSQRHSSSDLLRNEAGSHRVATAALTAQTDQRWQPGQKTVLRPLCRISLRTDLQALQGCPDGRIPKLLREISRRPITTHKISQGGATLLDCVTQNSLDRLGQDSYRLSATGRPRAQGECLP